jgi:hypothetical protein
VKNPIGTVTLLVAAAVVAEPRSISAQQPSAPRVERFATNPLLTVGSSATLGENVNGPTVIRVPDWVERPLGRYYMYFANHLGEHIRLAYADALEGPWTVYEPGVLNVSETAFDRPRPDPAGPRADFYTHVASPEVWVDHEGRRIVMWVHGWWTQGERWPETLPTARAWARERGYGQYTQSAESADGLRFRVGDAITRASYLRVFERDGAFFGVSRLGVVSRADDPMAPFELGPSLFADGAYAGRVRHLALLRDDDRLFVFFTAIGDAPERVMMSTVILGADWRAWRASAAVEVLRPEASYECTELPNEPSTAGDIDAPAQQMRDPFVFREGARTVLFYSTCGEQGIAGAWLELR